MKTNRRTLGQITARLHVLDKRGTVDALEIGGLLIEAKEFVTEGDQGFTNWLQANFAWSHRTADRFMRAKKWYEDQKVNARHCVDSGLTVTALYVISAEGVPAEAQRAILRLAKDQRVGGTGAHKIVAAARAKAKAEAETASSEPLTAQLEAHRRGEAKAAGAEETPSSEPEMAEAKPAPGSPFVIAMETLLGCDPETQDLSDLNAPDLIRAAETLTALARRLRGDDAVKLVADRAEAQSAMRTTRAPSLIPDVEARTEESASTRYCPIDHTADGAVPQFMCRSGLPHRP
jgi:hypothetical protein